jgi:AbrB family looped-hinge helix DNA binding protein
VRVQGQGRVTLPRAVRERLGLKTGSLVTFVEAPEGVVIKPAAVVANEALDGIGHALKAKAIKLQNLLERGREIRSELAAERYGLPVTKPEQAEQVREK